MSFISINLKLVAAAGTTLAAYGLYKTVLFLLRPYFSPLNELPGPPSKSYVWGHMEATRKSENQELHEKWAGQYGHVMMYKAFFGVSIPITIIQAFFYSLCLREIVFLLWTQEP